MEKRKQNFEEISFSKRNRNQSRFPLFHLFSFFLFFFFYLFIYFFKIFSFQGKYFFKVLTFFTRLGQVSTSSFGFKKSFDPLKYN